MALQIVLIPDGRTWSKLGEHEEHGGHREHGEHGKDGKHQPDDLKQLIPDSKHSISESKHSYCQPNDSKHSSLQYLWRRLKNHNIRTWKTWFWAGLHKLWYPTIQDTSAWSKFGAHGEHGDVFLFSNFGALWFSENLTRYSLHICLREIKNNLFSFKNSYLRHFSWRF